MDIEFIGLVEHESMKVNRYFFHRRVLQLRQRFLGRVYETYHLFLAPHLNNHGGS